MWKELMRRNDLFLYALIAAWAPVVLALAAYLAPGLAILVARGFDLGDPRPVVPLCLAAIWLSLFMFPCAVRVFSEPRRLSTVPVPASSRPTGGLWRYGTSAPEGKYLVTRRDGSVPEWLYFVLGARDPDAPGALRDYADRCERRGRDPQYVADVRRLADDMETQARELGYGDPDAPPHRTDDPQTIEKLRHAQGA